MNKKASQLPVATILDGSEKAVILQAGSNKTTLFNTLKSWILAGIGTAAGHAAGDFATAAQGAAADAAIAALQTVPSIVHAPGGEDDFSMFAGGDPPLAGYYMAIEVTKLWVFKSGWTKWRHADLKLST